MSTIDATVVVPVYNPGSAIESCIASLLAQSLPADRLEIIFSDDGSTDGTGERLDRLAEQHEHVQVIHSPNSGWPGRPRNLGIEAAHGEYIQFVDHDDGLGPQALERLVAYGRENHADIVIGKVTSNFRPVPHNLFRANIPACTIYDTALIGSLTPHKMFRRQFLLDTGIRYPEGKVRLEDQLFMVKTYFAARSVSVLSDYPCYFYRRRPEGEHAAAGSVEPDVYYHYLREVLDVIKANTEPGEFRDGLYRRFYRTMVRRTGKRLISGRPADYVQAYYDAVMKVADDYFTDAVADGLPLFRRTQSAAMRAGKADRLAKMTRRTSRARAVVRLESLRWSGTAWTAAVTMRVRHIDGTPIVVVPSEDGYRLDPRIVGSDATVRADSADELLAGSHADVAIQERHSGVRWFVPSELTPRLEPAKSPSGALKMVISGEIVIDPATLALGGPLAAGTWDLSVDFDIFGLGREVPLGPHRARGLTALPALLRRPARVARLRFSPKGRLVLSVRPTGKSQSELFAKEVGAISVTGQALTASVGLQLAGGPSDIACQVIVGEQGPGLPATITAAADGAELRCDLSAVGSLPRGRSVLRLQVKAADPAAELGVVTVGRFGRVTAAAARR